MARYFANTNSITQMQVTGEIPTDRFTWLAERLTANAHISIENTADEASIGWTRSDNIDEPTFDAPIAFLRDNYALFSLRHDKRSVNSAVLKSHIAREEKQYLAQNPNFRRTPKHKREEIKEAVRLKLFAKADPVPSLMDVVWDLNSGIVNVFSTSSSALDRFDELFRKTFDGFHLTVIHPFARAQSLVSGKLLEDLNAANQANSDSVVSLIKDNRWIGYDFLLWILYRGLNNGADYAVTAAGHTLQGEGFAAWIDEKIVMEGGGDEGNMQKVAVTGSQDRYKEVRSALALNKKITTGTIYIEHCENTWKISLNGDIFSFKSFKCPSIRIERDSTVDETSEIEAVFFEKTYLLEQGMQFFNSMFLAFLMARFSSDWAEETCKIQQWVEIGSE